MASFQQASQACVPPADHNQMLVGRRFEVRREGHGSFALVFQAGGRLTVIIQGQEIEDSWQPTGTLCRGHPTFILGGRQMPAAEVAIGPLPPCCYAMQELWEPCPPMGAPPLTGTGQRQEVSRQPESTGTDTVATKLEMIVDRSGSMQPLHSATVQGLNKFLADQRLLPHASAITMRLVVFDHQIETCWREGTPLSDTSLAVSPNMVQPRGQTALLDAIGTTLSSTQLTPPRVVCIVTDGCENSSTQFTRSQVNDLITARKNAGWTFIFLAANQDAIAVGGTLGIGAGTCATFSATPEGISGGFGSASAASCRGSMFGSGAAAFSSAERAACVSGRFR